MRFIRMLAVLLVAVAAFPHTSGVDALQSKTMIRMNGVSASAEWFSGEETDFVDTFIAADQTKDGTIVFVGRCSGDMTTGDVVCMSGETFVANSTFTVNKKLTSAALQPVTLELWDWEYTTSETVTVQADWSGTGAIQRGRTKFHWSYGGFKENYRDRSEYRDASATGSYNSADLGTSMYGGMVKYQMADMFMQK